MRAHFLMACLALAAPPGADTDRAEVVAEVLDVFDSPAPSAYATGRLQAGDVVVVRDEGPEGWLAIEPPTGSFQWIDEAALEIREGGIGVIRAERATLRSGRDGARMPGPPAADLPAGSVLRLIDRDPLTLRQGRSLRTWRAVEPPAGLFRYVRANGVARDGSSPHRASRPVQSLSIDPALVSIGRPAPAGLSPEFRAALARVEDTHRRELHQPIDTWNLAPSRRAYEALAGRAGDPAAADVIRDRLAHLDAQQAAAEAARAFAERLERSRRQDFARSEPGEPDAAPPEDLPYDATGLLEPSSKLVDGQRVFALIGPEGYAVAYLRPVPGVAVRRYIGRRVGVRGSARYDETLRAEVIRVQALEPLAGLP
jgi:hypothetical protein